MIGWEHTFVHEIHHLLAAIASDERRGAARRDVRGRLPGGRGLRCGAPLGRIGAARGGRLPLMSLPSGEQIEIAFGEQRAVVVEVGGGLRSYRAGSADLLDGYDATELSTSGRGQVLMPWPNRLQGGVVRVRRPAAPAAARRAGGGQRDPRPRPLGELDGRRTRHRAVQCSNTTCIRDPAIRSRSSSRSSTRSRLPVSGCRRRRRTSAWGRARSAAAPIRI